MREESSLLLEFTPRFNKRRNAAPAEIKTALLETLELFIENPNHPQLRNHQLKGKYAAYRSIDVSPDWRALFKTKKGAKQTTVKFYTLGTHTQLYGKI